MSTGQSRVRIRSLPRVVPAAAGKPQRPGSTDTQRFIAAVAHDAAIWDAARAAEMTANFDDLAESWDAERGGYRLVPLDDALNRGGALPPGLCVEIGAGTGLLTRRLALHWSHLMAIDLSAGMLARSPHPWRVRADASRLPIADACVATVVIGDAPLFAAELTRVTRKGSALIWLNALGDNAPFHLSLADISSALGSAGGRWEGVHSNAGWGNWTVLHRLGEYRRSRVAAEREPLEGATGSARTVSPPAP